MSTKIPDEAIEAAVKAIHKEFITSDRPDGMGGWKDETIYGGPTEVARVVLENALALLGLIVIPEKAIEAAAIAMGKLVWADYDHETDMDRDEHESNARAALKAAAPHILHAFRASTPSQYDAEFIANARTDVPYLLALARKQQAAIEAVRDLATKDECGSAYIDTIHAALEATP